VKHKRHYVVLRVMDRSSCSPN